jgi:hypothetical protein
MMTERVASRRYLPRRARVSIHVLPTVCRSRGAVTGAGRNAYGAALFGAAGRAGNKGHNSTPSRSPGADDTTVTRKNPAVSRHSPRDGNPVGGSAGRIFGRSTP